MSTVKTTAAKKTYKKPQVFTYGSITALTSGMNGSIPDGGDMGGSGSGTTPTPNSVLIPQWP